MHTKLTNNVLVVVLGAWGRGSSVSEAAANCLKAGGRKTDKGYVTIANCPVSFAGAGGVDYDLAARGLSHDQLFTEQFSVRLGGVAF